MHTARRHLGRTLGLGLMSGVLVLAACAAPAPAPATAPAPRAASGAVVPQPAARPAQPTGKLVVAVPSLENESVDPIKGSALSGLFQQILYDSLVGTDPEGKLDTSLGIANKWDMAPDGKTWTFTIRKGVTFDNGDEVTSADVKFTIERAMGPEARGVGAPTLRAAISGVETPDASTIVVKLKSPNPFIARFLSLSQTEGFIMPKKYLEAMGADAFNQKPIGTGAYRLTHHEFGSSLQMEAKPQPHWRIGVPRYQAFEIRIVPDDTTRIALVTRGEGIVVALPRQLVRTAGERGINVVLKKAEDSHWLAFHDQWVEGNPLGKADVRKALSLAIDRKAILDNVFAGIGEISGTAPTFSVLTDGVKRGQFQFPYDPQQAKQLLSRAGYPNGFKINLNSWTRPGVSEGPKMIEAIAQYWKDVGMDVTIVPIDYGTWRQKWQQDLGKLGVTAGWYLSGSRVWPLDSTRVTMHKNAILTYDKDPDAARLIDAAQEALDPKTRAEAVDALSRVLVDRTISAYLFELGLALGTTPDLKGWSPGLQPYTWNIMGLLAR